MKKNFTLLLTTCALLAGSAIAQNPTPTPRPTPTLGVVQTDSLGYKYPASSAWTVQPTTDYVVVIDENFQNWPLNHNKTNVSDATKGRAVATAYADWSQPITIKGGASAGQTAHINIVKCAVAPNGLSQNKIEFTKPASDIFKGSNSNYMNGQIKDPEAGAPLSAGFLEVSRANSNGTGANLSIPGATHGIVTLPAIQGALVVQYSYSSIGGSKRALKLERSVDNGATWQIIRNPMKTTVQFATMDTVNKVTYPSGADDVATEYNKKLSAYFCSGAGVYLEDYIGDGTETVKLRFTVNDCWKDDAARDTTTSTGHATGHQETQDYRIHDIRVIAFGGAVGVNAPKTEAFSVVALSDYVATSALANIRVYALNGSVVREAKGVNRLETSGLPKGVYFVKATANNLGTIAKKFVVR